MEQADKRESLDSVGSVHRKDQAMQNNEVELSSNNLLDDDTSSAGSENPLDESNQDFSIKSNKSYERKCKMFEDALQ